MWWKITKKLWCLDFKLKFAFITRYCIRIWRFPWSVAGIAKRDVWCGMFNAWRWGLREVQVVYRFSPTFVWIYRVIRNDAAVLTNLNKFSRCKPMWFLSVGLRPGSGLCSSSFHKYPGTEGTNQNPHWNHHRWHATNSLERTRLSCWCL